VPHISHLVEDRDITQNDVVDIVTAAWRGTLADVTEKLDGVNLVYTCTSNLQARAARNASDIKSGGMIGAVLEAKFTGQGLIQETFSKGFEALRRSMLCLTLREVSKAFENAHLWYSTEIVYTKNPNVVVYDCDTLVFHERPVFCFDGNTVISHDSKGFTAIEAGLVDMNESTKHVGWRVLGPQKVVFPWRNDNEPLDELVQAVRGWFGGEKTLQTALTERACADLKRFGMHEQLLFDAALRLSEAENAPTLTVLKSRVPTQVAFMLRTSNEWVAKQIAPLELAIVDFGVTLLSGVKPSMVADPDSEAKRIRQKLEESLVLVKKSRNQYAIDYVAAQMTKLKDPNRIVTPVEGVVFPWKDKLYKLTGAFAPANAILGLCRYGRGKNIPPIAG